MDGLRHAGNVENIAEWNETNIVPGPYVSGSEWANDWDAIRELGKVNEMDVCPIPAGLSSKDPKKRKRNTHIQSLVHPPLTWKVYQDQKS